MKTVKIIPVLMAAMLVSACNVGGSKVKVSEPKFAKENGSEMTSDDFLKEFVTIDGYSVKIDGPAVKDSEFFKEDAKIGSKEVKMKTSSAEKATLTRDGKEISKQEEAYVVDGTMQADSNNKVIKSVSTRKSSESFKNLNGSGSGSSSEKSTAYQQEGKVDDKNGVISANVEEKTYRLSSEFDTEEPRTYTSDTWFNLTMQSLGSMIGEGFIYEIVLAKMQSVELKGYKFYKNDKVYTITYSNEETETLKTQEYDPATSSYKEVEYATRTTKVEAKSQLDVTEGKWTYKTSTVEEVETKYLKDKGDYLSNDVRASKEEDYADYSVADKKVSVKAVDLKDYKVLKA